MNERVFKTIAASLAIFIVLAGTAVEFANQKAPSTLSWEQCVQLGTLFLCFVLVVVFIFVIFTVRKRVGEASDLLSIFQDLTGVAKVGRDIAMSGGNNAQVLLDLLRKISSLEDRISVLERGGAARGSAQPGGNRDLAIVHNISEQPSKSAQPVVQEPPRRKVIEAQYDEMLALRTTVSILNFAQAFGVRTAQPYNDTETFDLVDAPADEGRYWYIPDPAGGGLVFPGYTILTQFGPLSRDGGMGLRNLVGDRFALFTGHALHVDPIIVHDTPGFENNVTMSATGRIVLAGSR